MVGSLRHLKVLLSLALLAGFAVARAQDADPPTRVARLAYLDGAVSMKPSGAQDWVYADLNRPLTTGDDLWADDSGRAELELDGSVARVSRDTQLSILNLSDHVTQLQLSSGSLVVHVRRLSDDESYEIDTPNIAFSVLRPGVYRINVTSDGGSTSVAVYRGYGEATGAGQAYSVNADDLDTFTGTDNLQADSAPLGRERDDFANWSDERDRRYDNDPSAQYVSNDVVGAEDLNGQGDWTPTPEYGTVWFPAGVGAEWAPYHFGHWAYIAPWGYTWVDDRPWGFAPFHYGRWVSWRGRWGWVPAPPRVEGAAYVRPVYAPALVAWVGAGAAVAWFPLGPREVYVPSYPVSRGYVDRVNISNTRVNTTVINNVYNTTIINNTTVKNITYVNQRVPGAVMATSAAAFQSAQPVARNRAEFDARSIQNAPVRVAAPTIVPNRQAFLGPKGPGARPPQAVQARITTARIRPPAAPLPIAAREQAIKNDNGRVPQFKPAPAAEVRSPVRMAPPVRTLVSAPRVNEPASRAAPPSPAAPAHPPVHVNDLPPLPRGPSPAQANSVLERQHLQEQQQLEARQAAERAQMEAQQQREHQQLQQQMQEKQREAQQSAERARAEQQAQQQAEQLAQQRQAQQQAAEAQRQERERQIEAQHEQQTAQLAQEHAREQQEMLQRQQEQQREQHVQAPPPRKPPPSPPNKKQP